MDDEKEIDQDEQQQINDTQDHSMLEVEYLSGMYKTWFLDYASYVILERAVPHVSDGLKPVQRRILHSMKRLDDGRYNKVANIIGHTMQFHPHGDASIGDALVQLGQKDLLIDTQGNWGNVHTGDGAAASRYIEARLSKLALDILFNPKTTRWKPSYDGRNMEPITLPVKFPLLLSQGVEGIAVGLASKILPHNFVELIDASIAYLREKPFTLYPDFPTGGTVDVSRYNEGLRGEQVRVRARIEKAGSNLLAIRELPYGKTTATLIDSIIKSSEKGKIKIKKIDDNTAGEVEILIYLPAGISPDKTIDALYATTDCETSISPNSCIIQNDKPVFMPISQILKQSADNTQTLLKWELEIRKNELLEEWHKLSLERIFIENRIYKDKEYEEAPSTKKALAHIDKRLVPFATNLKRDITEDDLLHLLEIKMKRILRFNADDADKKLHAIEEEIKEIENHIEHIIDYTVNYYKYIKKTYSKGRERKAEISSFENIEISKVVVANEKLYINKGDGFAGTILKKDEYVCDCSDVDDIIIIKKDGTFMVSKVLPKWHVGNDVIHIAVFKKNDVRTIYNVVYQNGSDGASFIKRFYVKGITRDREYTLTQGTPKSKVLYFSVNPNGEAEKLQVKLKPMARVRKLQFEMNFADLTIKGRQSRGNILSRTPVSKIVMKQQGVSTLGGRKLWFDSVTKRLNADMRGNDIGEYMGDDQIIVFGMDGTCSLYPPDLSTHFYQEDILCIEKWDANKVYTAVFFDADQGYVYLKRFQVDNIKGQTSIIGENGDSKLLFLTDTSHPLLKIHFGGAHKNRPAEQVEGTSFIAVKSYKARGKRISTYNIKEVMEIENPSAPQSEVLPEAPQSKSVPQEDQTKNTEEPSLFKD